MNRMTSIASAIAALSAGSLCLAAQPMDDFDLLGGPGVGERGERGPRGGGQGFGGGPGGPGGAEGRQLPLSPFRANFDLDADGKLSEAERAILDEALPEYQAALVEPFDTDENGLLNIAEFRAASEELDLRPPRGDRRGGRRGPGGSDGPALDFDGEGKASVRGGRERGGAGEDREPPTAEEIEARMEEMALRRFDANDNGVLDADEREKLEIAMNERHVRMLERLDLNADAAITAEEVEEVKATARERAEGRRGAGEGRERPGSGEGRRGGQGGGRTGGMNPALIERFDTNGDGQLDQDEREAARAAIRERRNRSE